MPAKKKYVFDLLSVLDFFSFLPVTTVNEVSQLLVILFQSCAKGQPPQHRVYHWTKQLADLYIFSKLFCKKKVKSALTAISFE